MLFTKFYMTINGNFSIFPVQGIKLLSKLVLVLCFEKRGRWNFMLRRVDENSAFYGVQ